MALTLINFFNIVTQVRTKIDFSILCQFHYNLQFESLFPINLTTKMSRYAILKNEIPKAIPQKPTKSRGISRRLNKAKKYNTTLLSIDLWNLIISSLSLKELIKLCSTITMFHSMIIPDPVFYSCLKNSRKTDDGHIEYPVLSWLSKSWQQRIGKCTLLNPLEQMREPEFGDREVYENFFRCLEENDLWGMKFLLSFYSKTLRQKINIDKIRKYISYTKYLSISSSIEEIIREEFGIDPAKNKIELYYFLFVVTFLRGTKEMNILILEWLEFINDQVAKEIFPYNALQIIANQPFIFQITEIPPNNFDSSDSDTDYYYVPRTRNLMELFDFLEWEDECREWNLYGRYESAIDHSIELRKLLDKSRRQWDL